MSEYTAEEERIFLPLYNAVIKDLCDEKLGGYTPAPDNDDAEYPELYCPLDSELPAVYILRPEATTLALSAADATLRDIVIKTLDDWEPHRLSLTPETGVQYEQHACVFSG